MSTDNGHDEQVQDLPRRILDTARQVLITDGYGSLSMRNIARSIGYSATSIYLHFKNKDELVHALIDEGVDLLHARFSREVEHARDEPPMDRLMGLCRAYIDFGLSNPEYYEIMYILHPEYMARYPAEKYRKARRILLLLADALEEAYEEGSAEPVDPLAGASIIWAQLHGVVTLITSQRLDKQIDTEDYAEAACRRILRGFSVQSPEVAQP